jgi:hypothetical protein
MLTTEEKEELEASLPGLGAGRKILLIIALLYFLDAAIGLLISASQGKYLLPLLLFIWPLAFTLLRQIALRRPYRAFKYGMYLLLLNLLVNILFWAVPPGGIIPNTLGILSIRLVVEAGFMLILISCFESARVVEKLSPKSHGN